MDLVGVGTDSLELLLIDPPPSPRGVPTGSSSKGFVVSAPTVLRTTARGLGCLRGRKALHGKLWLDKPMAGGSSRRTRAASRNLKPGGV